MIKELEFIKESSENSEGSFKTTSDKYNKLVNSLKKTRILENRESFDKACENYKRIVKQKKLLDSEIQKKTNLSVDL